MGNKTNKVTTILAMKDGTQGAIRSAKGGVDGLTRSHNAMKLAAAAAFAAAAAGAIKATRDMARMTVEMATLGDDMDKLSKRTGLAVESLSEWKYVMERSGSSVDSYEKGIRRLATAMYDARRGSAEYLDIFNELNIGLVNGDGSLRDVNEVLLDFADRMEALASETEKTAYANKLLGRSGTQMLPALRGGRDAVVPLLERVRELNGVMGKDFADASAAFVDAQLDVKTGWEAMKRAVTAEFIKNATPVLEGLGTALGELSRHIEENPDIFEDLATDIADAASDISTDVGSIITKIDQLRDAYRRFKEEAESPVTKGLLGVLAAGMEMIPKKSNWAVTQGNLAYPEALSSLMRNLNSPNNPLRYLSSASGSPAAASSGPLYTAPGGIWGELAAPPARKKPAATVAPAASAISGDDAMRNYASAYLSAIQGTTTGMDVSGLMVQSQGLFPAPGGGLAESPTESLNMVGEALAGLAREANHADSEMSDAERELRDLAEYIPVGFADAIGGGLADAIIYAEDFGEAVSGMFQQLAAQVIAALAKIAIMKFFGLAQGGVVKAANGLVVGGQPGMDSVPALLMPGEAVVDRTTTNALAEVVQYHRRAQAAGAPSPVGSGSASVVNINETWPYNRAGEIRLMKKMGKTQRHAAGRTL